MSILQQALNLLIKAEKERAEVIKNEAVGIKQVFNQNGIIAAFEATVVALVSFVRDEILTSRGMLLRAQQARMNARMQRLLDNPTRPLPAADRLGNVITHHRNLQRPNQRHIMAEELRQIGRARRLGRF